MFYTCLFVCMCVIFLSYFCRVGVSLHFLLFWLGEWGVSDTLLIFRGGGHFISYFIIWGWVVMGEVYGLPV